MLFERWNLASLNLNRLNIWYEVKNCFLHGYHKRWRPRICSQVIPAFLLVTLKQEQMRKRGLKKEVKESTQWEKGSGCLGAISMFPFWTLINVIMLPTDQARLWPFHHSSLMARRKYKREWHLTLNHSKLGCQNSLKNTKSGSLTIPSANCSFSFAKDTHDLPAVCNEAHLPLARLSASPTDQVQWREGSLLMAGARRGNSRGEQQATPRQQTPTWASGARAQLPGWLFKESNVVQSTLSWKSEVGLGEGEEQIDPTSTLKAILKPWNFVLLESPGTLCFSDLVLTAQLVTNPPCFLQCEKIKTVTLIQARRLNNYIQHMICFVEIPCLENLLLARNCRLRETGPAHDIYCKKIFNPQARHKVRYPGRYTLWEFSSKWLGVWGNPLLWNH